MASPIIRLTPLLLLLSAATFAQELPKRDGPPEFELEPKLMLNDLPDLPLPKDGKWDAETGKPQSFDVAKLSGELERAKKSAAVRERLCRAGVFSKVEAEQAALRVVKLTKDLAAARAAVCTAEVAELQRRATAGEANAEALAAAEKELAALTTSANEAAEKWSQAQRTAAELRVQRERKLLAAGAGSRSQVKRAEAALQSLTSGAQP